MMPMLQASDASTLPGLGRRRRASATGPRRWRSTPAGASRTTGASRASTPTDDERRRREHQRGEDRERRGLRGLGVGGRQADDREHPRQREAEEQHDRHAAEQAEHARVHAEADEEADRRPSGTSTNTLRDEVGERAPASTAERAIGSDRNRSIRPLCRSSARPTPVWIAPNTTVCANMPGIR